MAETTEGAGLVAGAEELVEKRARRDAPRSCGKTLNSFFREANAGMRRLGATVGRMAQRSGRGCRSR